MDGESLPNRIDMMGRMGRMEWGRGEWVGARLHGVPMGQ